MFNLILPPFSHKEAIPHSKNGMLLLSLLGAQIIMPSLLSFLSLFHYAFTHRTPNSLDFLFDFSEWGKGEGGITPKKGGGERGGKRSVA